MNINDYNVVIFGNGTEWCDITNKDLTINKNVRFINTTLPYIGSKFLYPIFRLHHSRFINSIILTPSKKNWYTKYINFSNLDKSKPTLFIFYDRNILAYDGSYIKYLKNRFPTSRCIYLFTTLAKYSGAQNNNYLDKVKNIYDLVVTFDRVDAKLNSFNFYPGMYSMPNIDELDAILTSDILYVGNSKNRLNLLHDIYNRLTELGFNCDFIINGVNKKDKLRNSTIIYNKKISYFEVLNKVNTTRCILEIVQDSQKSYTLRTNEAVVFNKKLLTNNETIKDEPFFKFDCISIFSSSDDIKVDFLKKNTNKLKFNYTEQMSPILFINYIIKNLF